MNVPPLLLPYTVVKKYILQNKESGQKQTNFSVFTLYYVMAEVSKLHVPELVSNFKVLYRFERNKGQFLASIFFFM